MSNTVTIDANRQELWSKELMADVARDVDNIMRFTTMEENGNGVVIKKRDLMEKKGDTANLSMVARLDGFGVTGDAELEGNEEAMESFNEQVAIDQIREAVRLKGKLDAQKVVYDQIKPARENLRVWMKEFIVQQIFLKLGGVTNTTLTDVNGRVVGTRATWSNTPDFIPNADTASATGSGDRYLNAAGHSMATADSGDTMDLDLITDAETKAHLADPKIQPIEDPAGDFYVCYLHPLQARDIRKSSDWKTAQENARERSQSNPVFRGALGFWGNTLLLRNEFCPWLDISVAGNSFRGASSGTDFGVDSARAIFCGKGAVAVAEASNPDALVVEQFDYKNKDGVAISFIGGVQKIMFNSLEYGCIAIDTAAIA